ncbi:ASKHA domain-containing protein [Paradesulfitobacterium ferrireducens]|uniref:ASKHA domain-containing protein n=1 Tax=Paradesulfitobacterium ferrireducens TaxID=2816476 RepID=UPI001A8E7E1A|nr:ASKHA domain-containing protein [Paradesulfitobacterium ferrireducens]
MDTFKVTFLPVKAEVEVENGTTVMEAAIEAGIELEGPCGGKGTCGKCRVKLIGENSEEFVLACRTTVSKNLMVEIPHLEVSLHRKSELTQSELDFDINPGIKKVYLELDKPSLEDQSPDATRLWRALSKTGSFSDLDNLNIRIDVLRTLHQSLRQDDFKVTATVANGEVIKVEAGDVSRQLFGLAVDIGTTTVVASLVDLGTGETLATASATNTQNIFGADVIARIEHVMNDDRGLEHLNKRVVGVINRLLAKFAQAVEISPEEILQVAVVGNTTMSHLFLGLDPTYLASSPFIPVSAHLVRAEAKDLGLEIFAHAPVYMLPNIAGYVGADTVGVILSTGVHKQTGIRLAVDIGTNGEIVLAAFGKLWTCSTAAGPAFEGAQIQFGMRAATGAIEKVKIDKDVHLSIIGNAPAKGICGSGLMDIVSELVKEGIVDESGRMLSREQAVHLPQALQMRLDHNAVYGNHFILAANPGSEPVVITQKDVRELQLAKAAIYAGIEILLKEAGLRANDLDQVLLAGAFGSYIDKRSALALGLLPPVAPDKIISVGNAAGAGAKLALLSRHLRAEAEDLARRVTHVELSTRQDFQEFFMKAIGFQSEGVDF